MAKGNLLTMIIALKKAKHFGGRRDRHKRAKRLSLAKKRHGGMPF